MGLIKEVSFGRRDWTSQHEHGASSVESFSRYFDRQAEKTVETLAVTSLVRLVSATSQSINGKLKLPTTRPQLTILHSDQALQVSFVAV